MLPGMSTLIAQPVRDLVREAVMPPGPTPPAQPPGPEPDPAPLPGPEPLPPTPIDPPGLPDYVDVPPVRPIDGGVVRLN